MNRLRHATKWIAPLLAAALGGACLGAQTAARSGVRAELANCQIVRVAALPGSHQFGSNFLETVATDPGPNAHDANTVWALMADMSSTVPYASRALYLLQSTDGGVTWHTLARLGPKYFDAKIGEGLRNGLGIFPGGHEFVVTTQEGAFQVILRAHSAALIRPIPGPRVPATPPKIPIAKKPGQPVRAGVVKITADGRRMILGYGYFDLEPQLIEYRRAAGGRWVEIGPLPRLPTDLDIFSMEFDQPHAAHPRSLYVGTGDQAFRLDLRTHLWHEIEGVGPDSAIHSMSTVHGLHLAACWGVYNPISTDQVARVTQASFLLHPHKDQAGPNIRAYSVEVDPLRPDREVITTITGVYTSADAGKTWRRINGLPETEFHTSHFNRDGSLILSGLDGTFLANPFASTCAPRLVVRR
jgi:hypothetical protein